MSTTIPPDWLSQNSKQLVRAYTIATLKQYDITSKDPANRLLKIVDRLSKKNGKKKLNG